MKIFELINEEDYLHFPLHFYTMEDNPANTNNLWLYFNTDIEGNDSVKEFYKPISLP